MSTSLLGLRLIPRMVETWKTYNTTPRIVVVSSEVHNWSNLDSEKQVLDAANPFEVFGRSEKYITPAYALFHLLQRLFHLLINSVLNVRYQDTKCEFIWFL